MMVTCGNLKGGTSKSTVCFETAAALATRHEVVVLALDSNRSSHDRFVQHHHREPVNDELYEADDAIWPDRRRLNHLLMADDPAPDVDGTYLYRRDDLPNMGVLFHETGTLSTLASLVSADISRRRRLKHLLEYLRDNYEYVFVDCPADFDNSIVVEALMLSDTLLPVMTLTRDGLMAVKETFLTAVSADVPVHGFVISPYHRQNITEARTTSMAADVYASHRDLRVLHVDQDATVGKAQADTTPLVLYRPEELQRQAGHHLFDRTPPRALEGVEQVAAWLQGLAADPDGRTAAWKQRVAAHRERQQQRRHAMQ